jgi:hypothetical protein
MNDAPNTPQRRGRWVKGQGSPNPGGKRKSATPPQPAPQPPQAPQAGPQVASAEVAHAKVGQSENAGANAAPKRRGGTFQPGQSGNPAGKPKGTRHVATRLAEALIDGRAKELVDKAVEMALAGDPTAMRLVLDRLCPPRRERTVSLEMPSIKSAADLIAAASALTEATVAGDITPSEAASLSTLVSNVAKAVETVEIVARLERIEEQLGTKGLTP